MLSHARRTVLVAPAVIILALASVAAGRGSARADSLSFIRDVLTSVRNASTGVAEDPANGNLFVSYTSPRVILEVDAFTGVAVNQFAHPAPYFGQQDGLDFVTEPITIAGTAVPANTLLVGSDCPGLPARPSTPSTRPPGP